MLQRFLTFVSQMPQLWNGLRWLVEAGYLSHYRTIDRVLKPRQGASRRFLDLGCGTGQLTHDIAASGASVLGIDHSPTMVAKARANYPALRFEEADASDYHPDERFDAVFSNAALHWIGKPRATAACIHHALRSGGRFVAEFGGKGNVGAVYGALRAAILAAGHRPLDESALLYFPSLAEYAGVLEEAGLSVTYAILFDRPTRLSAGEDGLRTWITMFADPFLGVVPEGARDAVLRAVEGRLRPTLHHEGAWHADYRRLRVVARK